MMLTAPEFTSPRLTIRARATVTVAGLAKPAKAPDMETCPASVAASNASTATRSWRSLPHMKRPKTAPSKESRKV